MQYIGLDGKTIIRVSKLFLAPTGRLSTGHVLDVNQKSFEETLQFYDKQLYTKWNPKKLGGWGCWEIRRKADTKSVAEIVQFQDMNILKIDYVDFNDIHHVLDCAFLNYDALNKLKSMDAFLNKDHWAHDLNNLDAREKAHETKVAAKAKQEKIYEIRQHKAAMRHFMNLVRDGHHPGQILSQIKWDQ